MDRDEIIERVRAQSERTWPRQPAVMHAAVAEIAAEALASPIADALRARAVELDAQAAALDALMADDAEHL